MRHGVVLECRQLTRVCSSLYSANTNETVGTQARIRGFTTMRYINLCLLTYFYILAYCQSPFTSPRLNTTELNYQFTLIQFGRGDMIRLSLWPRPIWSNHLGAMCCSGRGSIPASARAHPPTKKELFQIIPMHMMTREIIPGRKTEGSTVSSINCDRSSLI